MSTDNKSATDNYDDIPFLSTPHSTAHPDHMATLASYLGMQPTPPESCRVLELACGNGINLIAMAQTLPESRFLGIDLSGEAISEGRDIATGAGIRNVELRHMNILDLDEDPGSFDYIIVSGAYSWVSDEIQHKILELCESLLSAHGIVRVHYITFPAWHTRLMFRDMLRFHVKGASSPRETLDKSRELVGRLSRTIPRKNDFNSMLLEYGLGGLERAPDSDIYHEFLASQIRPLYFSEFIEQAGEHGLRYLADSDLTIPQPGIFTDQIPEGLRDICTDPVELEQITDFTRMRMTRYSLLCRQDAYPQTRPGPEGIMAFHAASPARPDNGHTDPTSTSPAKFAINNELFVTTDDPLCKTAMMCLYEAWPGMMSLEALVDAAGKRLARGGSPVRQEDIRALADTLSKFYECGVLQFHTTPLTVAREVSERPAASPLSRYLASNPGRAKRLRPANPQGITVINLRGISLALDDAGAQLLAHMDGTRNRDQLRDVTARLTGQDPAVIDRQLTGILETFARRSLLIG